MNFDFLKGLRGLDEAYRPCTDAEELLRSKPYWSMAASRKGAEMLAKFIYMAAHYSAAEYMSFADILHDQQVQNFINDKSVIREFHHIRKSGNTAVHGDQNELCADDAIGILEELHHIAGETAKRLHLIDSYPEFNDNIGEYPDASFDENATITQKAQEMFLSYVIAEQAKHFVRFDDENQAHMDLFSKSIVMMHEYLEFTKPVNMKTTTEYIKKYVSYIVSAAVAPKDDKNETERLWTELYASVDLYVDGQRYTLHKSDLSSGKIPDEMVNGIEALDSAKSFSIDIHADGNLLGFYLLVYDRNTNESLRTINEDSPWMGHGMSEYLESIRRRENFTYKGMLVYNTYNYDSEVYYIKDGKSYDLETLCSPHIISEKKVPMWTGSSIILVVDFDFDDYPDLLERLHKVVKSYVPSSQLPYIEDVWEEEEHGVLLNGTDWDSTDLQEIQDFLNAVNTILEPIAETCEYTIEHCWYNLDEFAVAYIQLIEGRLTLSGKAF